jgi:hypothetical protein
MAVLSKLAGISDLFYRWVNYDVRLSAHHFSRNMTSKTGMLLGEANPITLRHTFRKPVLCYHNPTIERLPTTTSSNHPRAHVLV